MKLSARVLSVLAVLAVFAAIAFMQRDYAELTMAASYTGTATIEGPIRLDLVVSPPVGSPRDTMQLHIRVTNNSPTFTSPQIELQLPDSLRLGRGQLPTGMTANMNANTLQWLPVVPANASREEIFALKVSSADLTHPEQQVVMRLRTDSGEQTASALLWIGVPPRIMALDNQTHVSVGEPLSLGATIQGPGPFSETWDLGDGRRVVVNSPTVVFPTTGVFPVKVTVKNPVGEATYSTKITVVPHASADFVADDNTPAVGQSIVFSNVGGGQSPVDYWWDFGDGTVSNEAKPAHRFEAPGSYTVRLIAQNAFGLAETYQTLTVGIPPSAEIAVAESAPAGAQFSGEVAMSEGIDTSTQFSWDMGDGRRYESSKINHVFRRSGDYYVTMTASNEFGETKIGKWVHIDQGVLQVYMPMISNFSVSARGSSVDSIPQLANTSAADIPIDGAFVMEPIEFSAARIPSERLLTYINEARRQFDLPELSVSPVLSAAAQKHTADMAAAKHNQHTGSDGSMPPERLQFFGYENGYAGEATAWGFADPRQAVEFWVNSPGHRPIVLNRYATEVGLGYTVDYTAPSVWYWTAEFGNGTSLAEPPLLRIHTPATGHEMLNSGSVVFAWNWAKPLAAEEQFTIYLQGQNGLTPIGSVSKPAQGIQYRFNFEPLELPGAVGEFDWVVKLETKQGAEILSSEVRQLSIGLDPNLPTPTPTPTVAPTQAPTLVAPTIMPTYAATDVPPTPVPTATPLPILVTATPQP